MIDKNEDLLMWDDEQQEEPQEEGKENKQGGTDLFLDDPDKDDTKKIPEGQPEEKAPEQKAPEGVKTKLGQSVRQILGNDVNAPLSVDVDMVFVIDSTGSMEPFLTMIKDKAKTFHEDVKAGLQAKQRRVNKMRIRVIAFRDYYFDWADPEYPPMTTSDFFSLPEDQDAYAAFVDKLHEAGGLDEPESALEALHLAFHSDWIKDPQVSKHRQIVVLFTDASAHPLDDPMRSNPDFNSHYPQDMPATLVDLQEEYHSDTFPVDGNGYPSGRRLVLFAPKMYPWVEMEGWEEARCLPMDPQNGLEGLDLSDIIDFISGSIS